MNYRFEELESAIAKRSPLLALKLKPALSTSDIAAKLTRDRIVKTTKPIIALYSWRNGTVFDQALFMSKIGFFPCANYQFVDLDLAILHRKSIGECLFNPFASLRSLIGRYLPVFWDGATTWMALDLNSEETPIALIRAFSREGCVKDGHYEPEIHEKEPPREMYSSFEAFITDAIRANQYNDGLSCFKTP